MNLFQQLQPLAAAGVKFHFKLTAVGNDALQFDIIPVAKENAVGIALPVQALTGTAQELDEKFEAFLTGYLKTSAKINTMIEEAEAKLKEAEAEAERTIDAKIKEKAGSKPKTASTKPAGKPARNPGDDLSEMDEDSEDAATAVEPVSSEQQADTSPHKADAQALNPGLFV